MTVRCRFLTSGRHDIRRKEMPMTDATRRNVEAAFVGEAKAYFRLLAFAEKAQRRGIPRSHGSSVPSPQPRPSMQRAISNCSKRSVQRRKPEAVLREGDFRQRSRLPGLSETGMGRRGQTLHPVFHEGPQCRGTHAHLYKTGPSRHGKRKGDRYFVCSYCGWVETMARPEKCPNCGRRRSSTTK